MYKAKKPRDASMAYVKDYLKIPLRLNKTIRNAVIRTQNDHNLE